MDVERLGGSAASELFSVSKTTSPRDQPAVLALAVWLMDLTNVSHFRKRTLNSVHLSPPETTELQAHA